MNHSEKLYQHNRYITRFDKKKVGKFAVKIASHHISVHRFAVMLLL